MLLARRDWFKATAAAWLFGKAWAEADQNIVGEDISRDVLQWNRRPPRPNFRPGNTALGRGKLQVVHGQDRWEATIVADQAIASPLVVGDRVYVGSGFSGHEFHCLDAGTGRVLWTARLSDNGPAAAAYSDGVVYITTESCTLFALNADTGRQLWSLWLGDPLPTMPAVANGRVFAVHPAAGGFAGDGHGRALTCLDAKTGRVQWMRWIDNEILSCPVADREDVYVATFGGILYGFRQADGALRLAVKSNPTSAPVLVKDYVLYSRVRPGTNVETVVAHAKSDNRLLLESKQRGTRHWPQDNGAQAAYAYQGSRPVYSDGRIFVSLNDEVHCLGAVHGMPYWSQKVEGALPPILAGTMLVAPSRRGEIVLLDRGTGDIVTRYDVGQPLTFLPVVDQGRIFAVTTRGKLVCIDTNNPQVSGWPCWGGHAHRNAVV